MIRPVEQEHYPYILEEDRASKDPTIFYLRAKTGQDSNKTMQRYLGTSKENARKGTREVNVNKLNAADIEEFQALCLKVENFAYPKHSSYYNDGKPYQVIDTPEMLAEVVRTISTDHLQEIFEASANINKLSEGTKKNLNS